MELILLALNYTFVNRARRNPTQSNTIRVPQACVNRIKTSRKRSMKHFDLWAVTGPTWQPTSATANSTTWGEPSRLAGQRTDGRSPT